MVNICTKGCSNAACKNQPLTSLHVAVTFYISEKKSIQFRVICTEMNTYDTNRIRTLEMNSIHWHAF